MLRREKNLKAIRGNGYRFVPKGGTFPTETTRIVVRSLYPNLPQMGQIFYHGMLMPLHDSIQSFMNFRRVSGLLYLKTRHLNVLPEINGALVFEIHSHFLHGPNHAPKDPDLIFNQFICTGACACGSNLNYAHKCIENPVNA